MKKKILRLVLPFLVILLLGFFLCGMQITESLLNRVLYPPPYAASEKARWLHSRLLVADLHADSLLWGRDLLAHGSRGHVDIPRLIEGGVALQAFTVVTKVPFDLNIERNTDRSDQIFFLQLAQLRPLAGWCSLVARALDQAQRLSEFSRRSEGRLVLIRSAADLARYIGKRRSQPGITAGFLGIEGAHALDGKLENLVPLNAAGFRMIGLTHFFDNEFAGSAHGVTKYGLTEKGRELIRRMEAAHLLVDLAHSSPQTIADVLAMATRPVVASHGGVKGTCDNTRNLSDEQLRGIARTGGVIGIGYWETAVCGKDAAAIARAIRHAVSVAGIDHVGLGSDFDGAIPAPFDTSGLVQITDALLAQGFSEDEIAKIMGGNTLRVLAESLPEN